MPDSGQGTRFLFLQDFRPGTREPDIEELRRQLNALPGFKGVDLSPNGRSTVRATVPGGNRYQHDRLKALADEQVRGWRVIEEESYGLPNTF